MFKFSKIITSTNKKRIIMWWLGVVVYCLASALTVNAAEKTLLWSDEFNDVEGQRLYRSNWRQIIGQGIDSENGILGWGNNQIQCYTNNVGSSAMDGLGNLVITVRNCSGGVDSWCSGKCNFTSTQIVSSCGAKYGRVEVRMKIPFAKGLRPGIWMLGSNMEEVGWPQCGAIDVAQFTTNNPNIVISSGIYGPSYGSGIINEDYVRDSGTDDEYKYKYHVYAIDWDENTIKWSMDDTTFATQSRDRIRYPWVFDHNFNIVIQLAIGKDFVDELPTNVTANSLVIDYVKVYSAGSKQAWPSVVIGVITVSMSLLVKMA